MSKQLAVAVAFSILMMATYVLFGAQTVREPLGAGSTPVEESQVQVAAPGLPDAKTLLPALR
jgi:hypothetical protein